MKLFLLLPAVPLVALAAAALSSRDAPPAGDHGRITCVDTLPLPPPPQPMLPCGDGSCTAPAPA